MLKELNREMSIESVEKLMEETAEAVAYQRVSTSTFPPRAFLYPHPEGCTSVHRAWDGRRLRGTWSGAARRGQCGAAPREPFIHRATSR